MKKINYAAFRNVYKISLNWDVTAAVQESSDMTFPSFP